MQRCVYCDDRNKNSFTKKAHVLSQFMGNFQPDIYFRGDVVCDDCNSELGKTIERHFAEKSFEGLIARLHLRRKRDKQSAVILFNSSLLKFRFHTEESITYDPLFLLIKSILNKVKSVKDPLLLLKKGNLYAFIFVEDVILLKSENKVKKLQQRIKVFREGTELGEWIGDKDNSAEIVQCALPKLGLKANFDDESVNEKPKQIKSSFIATQSVDTNTARFIAKVIFEYFVYCANESSLISSVFSEELKPIRDFIKGGKGNAKNFVSVINNDFVSPTIKQQNNYYFLAFEVINGFLVGKVAFMDSLGYKVNIGRSPLLLSENRIGNAHAFNLTNKTTKKMYSGKIPKISTSEFSIYNK